MGECSRSGRARCGEPRRSPRRATGRRELPIDPVGRRRRRCRALDARSVRERVGVRVVPALPGSTASGLPARARACRRSGPVRATMASFLIAASGGYSGLGHVTSGGSAFVGYCFFDQTGSGGMSGASLSQCSALRRERYGCWHVCSEHATDRWARFRPRRGRAGPARLGWLRVASLVCDRGVRASGRCVRCVRGRSCETCPARRGARSLRGDPAARTEDADRLPAAPGQGLDNDEAASRARPSRDGLPRARGATVPTCFGTPARVGSFSPREASTPARRPRGRSWELFGGCV